MKCPKCGYLGFERVERCRNCGYDFLRSVAQTVPDLSMRASPPDTVNPLADLAMIDAALESMPLQPEIYADFSPDAQRQQASGIAGPTPELPLFGSSASDDLPLITRPSPPRTPLAVRRATPEVPRLRPEARSTMFDLTQTELEPASSRTAPARSAPLAHAPVRLRHVETEEARAGVSNATAPVTARVVASAIDVAVLLAIDLAVVYLTMKICGLGWDEIGMIPKAPLVAFLVLQNASYFVAFTVGGQTLGQMAMGIKVVSTESEAAPDWRQAILRTGGLALLAIPAGLGLLTALFSPEHRGLHDRLAGTRVVRTSV